MANYSLCCDDVMGRRVGVACCSVVTRLLRRHIRVQPVFIRDIRLHAAFDIRLVVEGNVSFRLSRRSAERLARGKCGRVFDRRISEGEFSNGERVTALCVKNRFPRLVLHPTCLRCDCARR